MIVSTFYRIRGQTTELSPVPSTPEGVQDFLREHPDCLPRSYGVRECRILSSKRDPDDTHWGVAVKMRMGAVELTPDLAF